MSTKGLCRWCKVGKYYGDGIKWNRDWHLCYECTIIADLNVQHLVPASERKPSNVMWPRTAYKVSTYKVNSRELDMGTLGRTDPPVIAQMRNFNVGGARDD